MLRKRMTATNELYNKPFPSALRELMRERNTTQQELAKVLGRTRQSVSYYCDGSSSPDWETIAAIAKFYSVSSDWLLGLTDVRSTNADIHAVCEFTGLSESAVNGLKTHSSRSVAFISKLIAQGEITHIGLLYDGLIHSVSNLNTATNLYENIDPASSHPADVKVVRDYYRAKDNADIAQWKLERSVRKLLEKMLKGEKDHGID